MTTTEAIDFYWRPGCPFCSGLERNLDKLGLPLTKHNIWENPSHAETVRSIANGNETVPTVVVGDAKMVNPSAGQVVAAVAEHAPTLLPEGVEPTQQGRAGRLINKLFGE